MATKEIHDWIDKFIKFFNEDCIDKILELVDIDEKFVFENTYKNIFNREDLEKNFYQKVKLIIRDETLTKIWSEYMINHYLFRINKFRENYVKSFTHLKECYINFIEIFKIYECPYFLNGLVKYYMRNLYFSSQLADEELERQNQKPNLIDECGRILITFFSNFQQGEEKPLVFYCIICLIRIHFKLKTYRNSKTLVGWVEKSNLDFDELPKSEVTTYLYYSGRLLLYELKIAEARDIFQRAFSICKNNQIVNKKLILEYLIPLNLFVGSLPNYSLLEKYDLNEYKNLIEAYKVGDIIKFEETIVKLDQRLINLGTFLIIEKLKPYVFRNLIKLVYKNYFDDVSNIKTPVIKIDVIHEVIRNVYKKVDLDKDELEWLLIGVIHKGLISGYVHNTNKAIVFSKKKPFPELYDAFKENYNKII